ncbi:MAG: hypothetical protein PVG70_05595 [Desulfobacterales bacterium]|jgi:hypothetical protein
MTHRERLLSVARGEMVDTLPWIPRIDLWHNANVMAGTLPQRYRRRSPDPGEDTVNKIAGRV